MASDAVCVSLLSEDEDDACGEVQAPSKRQKVHVATDVDEDVVLVSESGAVAGRDFAHVRSDCVVHPFATTDAKACCKLCFCYVCDDYATRCPDWLEHCHALPTDERWHKLRLCRRASSTQLAFQYGGGDNLRLLCQVYPRQCASRTAVALFPPQQQMLQFAIDVETHGVAPSFFVASDPRKALPRSKRPVRCSFSSRGSMCPTNAVAQRLRLGIEVAEALPSTRVRSQHVSRVFGLCTGGRRPWRRIRQRWSALLIDTWTRADADAASHPRTDHDRTEPTLASPHR